MGEGLTLVAQLTGLPFLVGVRPYATLFVFGMLLTFGYITDPFFLREPFQLFTNPFILVVLGVFFLADTFADMIPVVGHVSDIVHTVIKPLAGALLGFMIINAVDTESNLGIAAIAFAVTGGGAAALSTHAVNAAGRMNATRLSRGMANPIFSGLGDAITVGGTFLLVTFPIVAGVVILLFCVLFVRIAPTLFSTFKTLVTAPFSLFSYWLGIGRGQSEDRPVQ